MLKRAALAGLLSLAVQISAARADDFVWLSQSGDFSKAVRDEFYSQDQGSRMIPYAWLKALRRSDGQPFLADSLARYGYLGNPQRPDGLPVGFTTLDALGPKMVGMTCAACHTRQIVAEGKAYRIDGGPAIVDFQRLLTDLDASVGAVLADDARFAAFAAEVKTVEPTTDPDALKGDVQAWFKSFDAIVSVSNTKAANHSDWGFGRLDAISMIFNRVTGLDIGAGEDRIIPENMAPANAPARYPFLWNVDGEAWTQWPGFAPNDPLGGALGRNVGEVMGVFARFDPPSAFFPVQPSKPSSVNFGGMQAVEEAVRWMPAPKWPWGVDQSKADRGAVLFQHYCSGCHDTQPGRLARQRDTQAYDVCTDSAEARVLDRRIADAGVMKGALTYNGATIADDALAADVLKSAVIGAILQHYLLLPANGHMSEFGDVDLAAAVRRGEKNAAYQIAMRQLDVLAGRNPIAQATLDAQRLALQLLPDELKLSELANALTVRPKPSKICILRKPNEAPAGYEARYLGGVWAAAPYLHDGGVATLRDLLEPAAKRRPSFKIGPNYDLKAVGLAEAQPDGLSSTLTTTDCNELDSGRSRCGHEGPDYGTDLGDTEKAELLEYLKGL